MATVNRFEFPDDLSYQKTEHLWLRNEGNHVVVGLDQLSVEALGNVVHVELKPAGTAISQGEEIGSLEAEKMVSSLIAPISGELARRNERMIASPATLLNDPYGAGWLVAIEPAGTGGGESGDLVAGPEEIQDWAEVEVTRYTDNGWVD